MNRIVFCFLVIFPLSVVCQNKWKTVDYNSVSVQIPFDWGNKNIVNYYEENNVTEFQISCWSKENESMSLALQWLDIEVDGVVYIETLMDLAKERMPIFKQFKYSKIEDTMFLDTKAKKCSFSMNLKNESVAGEYISFNKNQHSYIVMILGDKSFYKSETYNYILNNIKPNFSGIKQQENGSRHIETKNDFTKYEFNAYSLSIPNTMEMRDENSITSLFSEIHKDKLENTKKINIGDVNFVFQPAGYDDISNNERRKKALDLYARILINYQKSNKDDFFSWNEDIKYTQEEYNQLNKSLKNNLLNGAEQAKQMGMMSEFVKIDNIQIAKNSNKFIYIKQQYIRKGLNGDVKVVDYYISNRNEMVKLTISYRISESDLWESDFDKIVDTFSFTIKK